MQAGASCTDRKAKNARICVPLVLADRDGVSSEDLEYEPQVLRQARNRGRLQGARHGQERQDGPGRLKDSDKEVTAFAVASVQDRCILVQLSMWPEP